jgi:hypothetical protein
MRNFVHHNDHGLGAVFDVPSSGGFIALLEAFRASGGTAPGEVVGRLLEANRVGNAVSLAKLIYTGQAFGFEWRANLWIPMFQFDAVDLALKAGAQQVRAELPPLWSGWTLASWFAAPNVRLDGRSPVDMLEPALEAVLRAARSPELVGNFAVPLVRRAHEVAAHV